MCSIQHNWTAEQCNNCFCNLSLEGSCSYWYCFLSSGPP